jgi:phosphatidylserine/phosphatidylglycerophosphate/cardiolipin synthase-like enzyme
VNPNAGAAGLYSISTHELEQILREIRRGNLSCPVTRAGLVAAGLGNLADRAAILYQLDQAATGVLLEALLAERARPPATKVELVWTGPEGRQSSSRDTRVVLRELLESATTSVLIGGYSFDHGDEILKPLHESMRDRAVQAAIFLHLKEREPEESADGYVERRIAMFIEDNWTFGPPIPTVYYDPRTVEPKKWTSLHAKCVVVDERRALVTSANFTRRAQTRNIEVGALVEDEMFAKGLVHQWMSAVEADLFKRIEPT